MANLTVDSALQELEAVRRKADNMYEGQSTGVTEIVAYSAYALGVAILTAAQLVSEQLDYNKGQLRYYLYKGERVTREGENT